MPLGRSAGALTISILACALLPFQGAGIGGPAARANPGAQNKSASASLPPPAFIDMAAQLGLTVPHVSSPEKKYILESMSGGVGMFDCDGDGLQDIVVVNGSTIDHYRRGGDPMVTLYHQEPGGRFTDISEPAGLTRRGWGMGVAVADFDNDGRLDLFVTGYGGNVLYRSVGNCKFEDVTEKAGLRGGGFSTGAAWGDYDRDGNVDLFVSRYVHMDIDHLPEFGKGQHCVYKGVPVQCGPWGMEGESDLLYHNRGDGTFEEVSEKAGVHDAAGNYGLGVVWSDYDNDGWPDLFVANDSGPNYLYHNNHNGTFTETAMLAGVAYSGDGGVQGNMGVDFGDYDHRGLFDIFVTTFADQADALYRNLGPQGFGDASLTSKLGQASFPFVKWGTGFFDMDNRGWLDLFVACGHVYPQMDHAQGSAPYREPMLLYRNNGDGTFADVSARAGLAKIPTASRRGAAFGDVFNNGNVDIVILNIGEPPTFLVNTAQNANHRVLFQLQGTQSNRAAVGARVTVKAGGRSQLGEVRGGASYLSQNDLRLHFGLGADTRMDGVEIRWPGGNVETVKNLAADFMYTIVEGKGVQNARSLPPPDAPVTPSARPQ